MSPNAASQPTCRRAGAGYDDLMPSVASSFAATAHRGLRAMWSVFAVLFVASMLIGLAGLFIVGIVLLVTWACSDVPWYVGYPALACAIAGMAIVGRAALRRPLANRWTWMAGFAIFMVPVVLRAMLCPTNTVGYDTVGYNIAVALATFIGAGWITMVLREWASSGYVGHAVASPSPPLS